MMRYGLARIVVFVALAAVAGTRSRAESEEGDTPPPPSSATAPRAVAADDYPHFNLYLPEGEFDIKVRRTIRNVLFEGQVNYNFVNGDISTFLRYKYYARNFTYRIGVFDAIEFESIEAGTDDFNRTRGGLLLFEVPVDVRNRWLALVEADAQTFGDVTNPDHRQDNIYVKLGYQFGTPFDERLNAIVGEVRGRITPVATSYREIGHQRRGVVLAVTQGLESIGGDYQYTKVEAEGLQRFDLGSSTFLITRVHAGTFARKEQRGGATGPDEGAEFAVPRSEYFRIGGRDALKGLDDSLRGSDEIHWSNELFTPVFRGREFRTWRIRWSELYGIGYVGTGNLGFGSATFTEAGDWVADAGIGFEAIGRWRDYAGYLTVIYARSVVAPPALQSSEIRVSVRTLR